MSSGSSTSIINGLIYVLYYHSATVIFILSNIKITKKLSIFLYLTKFNNTGYLPLYSGCLSTQSSHSGSKQPSIACCSIVVPSSQAHRSRYGNILSISYHGCNLLLSFLCFAFRLFSCKKGKRCDNLYL